MRGIVAICPTCDSTVNLCGRNSQAPTGRPDGGKNYG